MPKVPEYNGPQVLPGQMPGGQLNVSVTPDTFGAQVGRGLQDLGAGVNAIYKEEQYRAQSIQLDAVRTQARNRQTDLMYGSDGIMKKQGGALFGVAGTAPTEFDTELKGLEDGLTSPRVKRAFAEVRNSMVSEFSRSLAIHVAGERIESSRRVATVAALAEVDSTSTVSAANPTALLPVTGYDPAGSPVFAFDQVDRSVESIKGAFLADMGRNPGAGDPSERELMARESAKKPLHQMLSSTFNNLMALNEVERAQALFNRYVADFPPDHKDSAILQLRNGNNARKDQEAVAALALAAKTPRATSDGKMDASLMWPDSRDPSPQKPPTISEQYQRARELAQERFKGDDQDRVIRRLGEYYENAQRAQDISFKQNAESLLKDLQETKITTKDQLERDQRYVGLDAGRQTTVMGQLITANAVARPTKIHAFEVLAYSSDPAERQAFAKDDLTRHGLNNAELKHLFDLQNKVRAELGGVSDNGHSAAQAMHAAASEVGKMVFKDDPALTYELKNRLFEEQKLKPVFSPEELRKRAQALALTVQVPGTFGMSKSVRAFTLTPSQIAAKDTKVAFNDIPAYAATKIREDLVKAGTPSPTKDQIAAVYTTEWKLTNSGVTPRIGNRTSMNGEPPLPAGNSAPASVGGLISMPERDPFTEREQDLSMSAEGRMSRPQDARQAQAAKELPAISDAIAEIRKQTPPDVSGMNPSRREGIIKKWNDARDQKLEQLMKQHSALQMQLSVPSSGPRKSPAQILNGSSELPK